MTTIPEDKTAGEELSATEVNKLRDAGYVVDLNAGETINGATLPVAIYIDDATNEVYACDGDDQTKLEFVGFAISNSTDGNPIQIQNNGIVSGFTGLDIGKKYYVQDDKTIGTAMGTYEVLVGVAISATQILIMMGDFEYMGSAAFSGSGTTTSWSGTAAMPANARFAICVATGSATDMGSIGIQRTIARKGCTSGNQATAFSTNNKTVTISLSGDTITLSVSSPAANSSWSCSGTCYFYR